MSSITYGICEELYEIDGKSRISYGIIAYSDAMADDTKTILASVRDVSVDRTKISELIQTCNDLELSPLHLEDVVADFLED